MTTYTQAEPFIAPLNKYPYWRDDATGVVMTQWSDGSIHKAWVPRAIAEFVEAEASAQAEFHPATWTEQEDGSWRKGAWTVTIRESDKRLLVAHDEFGMEVCDTDGDVLNDHASGLYASKAQEFLAWHPIDPPQPEEPTKKYAAVTVGLREYVRMSRSHRYPWRDVDTGTLTDWRDICAQGPVTIESPGVVL